MGYLLYSHDGSGGFIAEAALVKSGADFEIAIVDTEKDEHMRPDFVALNPLHQVPALVLPSGEVMTESAAITIYLASIFPSRGLSPEVGSPGHAAFLRWMVFMSVNLYEACLRSFYPQRYTSDPECAPAVQAAGESHVRRSLAVMEDALGEEKFITGADMSMADVYLAMLMAWAEEKTRFPKLNTIVDAVAADEVFGPLWRRHGF